MVFTKGGLTKGSMTSLKDTNKDLSFDEIVEKQTISISKILLLILIIPIMVYDAWVTKIIWNWYMPMIFSLPYLTVNKAIAIGLVWSQITSKPYLKSKEWNLYQHICMWEYLLLMPAVLLFAAWALLQFIS